MTENIDLDKVFLDLVLEHDGSELVDSLNAWKMKGDTETPCLVQRLVDESVLSKSSINSLKLIHKGYLSLPDYQSLVVAGSQAFFDELKELVPDPVVVEEAADAVSSIRSVAAESTAHAKTTPVQVGPKKHSRLSRTTRSLKSIRIDVGTVLGKCLLTERIGAGSSCTVYRGFHQTLKVQVAVKVFPPETLADEHPFRKFIDSEAQLLAQLNHPSIVRILDLDQYGSQPYLVLEYVDGLTLAELIQQSGCLSPRSALRVCLDIAFGLECAVENNVIHRDIKPANILITKNGQAKVGDFGLATSPAKAVDQVVNPQFGNHIPVGTPAYMAPEQAFGEQVVDHRSDIYALGATMYECLSGRRPFMADDMFQLMIKHLSEPLVPLSEIVPDIPLGLSKMVSKMMNKDPVDRFQSYSELLGEIENQYEALSGNKNEGQTKTRSSSFLGTISSWFSGRELR